MRFAVALVLLTSCSFVFVSGPPSTPPKQAPVECTDSYILPTVDVAIAGLALGFVVWGVTTADCGDQGCGNNPGKFIGGAVGLVGAIDAFAGVVGFIKVSSCRDMKRDNPPPGVDQIVAALVEKARRKECAEALTLAATVRDRDRAVYENVIATNPEVAACKAAVREQCLASFAEGQKRALELPVDQRGAALRALPNCDR